MTTTTTTTRATSSDSLARLAIRIDGTVVGVLGVAMIAAAAATPSFTGLPAAVEYVIGAISVPFLPLGYWLAAGRHARRGAYVFAEINVATSIGLLAVLLTGVGNLTATGTELAMVLAVYTAAIGLVQYAGARRA